MSAIKFLTTIAKGVFSGARATPARWQLYQSLALC
jgi:hypothetical protein